MEIDQDFDLDEAVMKNENEDEDKERIKQDKNTDDVRKNKD